MRDKILDIYFSANEIADDIGFDGDIHVVDTFDASYFRWLFTAHGIEVVELQSRKHVVRMYPYTSFHHSKVTSE